MLKLVFRLSAYLTENTASIMKIDHGERSDMCVYRSASKVCYLCQILSNIHRYLRCEIFTKIIPMGVALMHVDGQTDIHDQTYSHFSQSSASKKRKLTYRISLSFRNS
jgi:hypothetical protein